MTNMRVLFQLAVIALAMSRAATSTIAAAERIDLSGQWQVRLDPDGKGTPENLAGDNVEFQPVVLPGALRDSDLGDPVGPDTHWIGTVRRGLWEQPKYAPYHQADQFKVPFWLQPNRHYVGAAWYRRTVTIPDTWRNQRILLTLERPHWRTKVWVDGEEAGEGESLSTPHVFDLTKWLTPGVHTILTRVHNGMEGVDVGLNSHSVSDHTQSAWHGVVGRMELRAEPRVAIENTQIYPAMDGRSARVVVQVVNTTDEARKDTVVLDVLQQGQTVGKQSWPIHVPAEGTTVEHTLQFEREVQRWDEFNPNLCVLTAVLQSDEEKSGERRETFAVRHVRTRGTQIVLNDRPVFLRGTLECCIFPLTGYPPTDVASWKRIVQICKAHGLNHIRFHSWCPPEAAFIAADELGFYYQVECSTWPNVSTALGQDRPIDQWLYREGERILAEYGNHPSFLLFASGNEPAGPERGGRYLGPWVEHFKKKTDRQLVTSGAGWPSIPENEFHVTPAPRIQQWGQGIKSRINALPPETRTDYSDFVKRYEVPVVSHEIGQWCVYPNLKEMEKYTGTLKPRNFEIFRDLLGQAHMLDQAHDFLMASGKLQALCYKEEIESALRTSEFGGFQLLDLHDFPGQGTALVGILDPFWDSKPFISPAEFRQFCNATVPLVRMSKRLWTNDETLVADVEVSNFGPSMLRQVTPRWSVTCGNEQAAAGKLATQDIPDGRLTRLGRLELPLARFTAPAKLTLTVSVEGSSGAFENCWDIWVYPRAVDARPSPDVMVATKLDDDAIGRLKQGGKVLLLADPRTVKGEIQIGFSSIFWNTAWTDGQAPHTLGILCDPEHPLFDSFPTDFCSNWQWWELVSRSKPMTMDALPTQMRPLVQVVPDWFNPQRLGLLFEAQVAEGKLVVCSVDLQNDLSKRPVARQLRKSLMRYMSSESFVPNHELQVTQVESLFREAPLLQKLGATAWADSQQEGHEAALAIDGNPTTMWHTAWEPTPTSPPHWIAFDLKKSIALTGIRYLPRTDMTNGRIGSFEVHLSDDGKEWIKAAAGQWSDDAQAKTVQFERPQQARFLKIVALREVKNRAWSSIAEIDILVADEEEMP